MEIQKTLVGQLFKIKILKDKIQVFGDVVGKGRHLIGRSESCDIVVDEEGISAVHAVLEVFDTKAKIYDMNSTNGTFVNNEKIITKELNVGDRFSLADVEFVFNRYSIENELPPVLDSLEPSEGSASVKLPSIPAEEAQTKKLPVTPNVAVNPSTPYVLYPLAADPKAEFSEYIFEDVETLYPIFKYDHAKQAVEVIILHQDHVFSVDYLSEKDGLYHLVGKGPTKQNLEFPYLRAEEKTPFVELRSGRVSLHKLPGYEIMHLSEKQAKSVNQTMGTLELAPQDIVRLYKGDLQIFVRQVQAPPQVASAPILKRDPEFRQFLIFFFFLVLFISVSFQFVDITKDEKEEEDKDTERLATILIKQPLKLVKPKVVVKPAEPPKIPQMPSQPNARPDAPPVPQPVVKNPDVMDIKNKIDKPDPGEKTAPVKQVVKKGVPKPTPQKPVVASNPVAKSNQPMNNRPAPMAYSRVTTPSAGPVDVYKSADFSSSVSSALAKSGSLSGVPTSGVSQGTSTSIGGGGSVSGSTGSGVKNASISSEAGSLVGADTGVIGVNKGAGGLSSKKAIYTAGIPSETVVLGSMDPDVIRRILLDHLPQFRHCYQSELERSGAELQGVIKLDFNIGASGHVTQAGVDNGDNLPGNVKKCVANVLKGIQFPEPMGGGTVEVKQPMNFYPKKL